jgi:hypothetical protein
MSRMIRPTAGSVEACICSVRPIRSTSGRSFSHCVFISSSAWVRSTLSVDCRRASSCVKAVCTSAGSIDIFKRRVNFFNVQPVKGGVNRVSGMKLRVVRLARSSASKRKKDLFQYPSTKFAYSACGCECLAFVVQLGGRYIRREVVVYLVTEFNNFNASEGQHGAGVAKPHTPVRQHFSSPPSLLLHGA